MQRDRYGEDSVVSIASTIILRCTGIFRTFVQVVVVTESEPLSDLNEPSFPPQKIRTIFGFYHEVFVLHDLITTLNEEEKPTSHWWEHF